MPYVVGLTGGIGSGKSTIAYLFQALGVPVVDADIVAREIVAKGEPCLAAIAAHFGDEILLENGELNRTLLREKIFATPCEKQWLENLLHPAIRQRCLQKLADVRSPYVLFVAPLLIENQLTDLCDAILVVDVSENTQIERTMKRDRNSQALVQRIINAQVSRQTRLSYATQVLENEGDLVQTFPKLAKKVLDLHELYGRYAIEKNK